MSIDDVYEWSKATPTCAFLKEWVGIEDFSCRAQFYNILACVSSGNFNRTFIRWVKSLLQGGIAGKTAAIDGNALPIVSAVVSECGIVIGSHECGGKTGETTVFRELIEILDVSGTVAEAGADYLFSV